MIDVLVILLPVLALLGGGFSIFLGYRLMRRFRSPFTVSYFYYLVFIMIFGFYGLMLTGFIEDHLKPEAISTEKIEVLMQVTVLLGIPFLILSGYMFMRALREFRQGTTPRYVNYLYFLPSLTGYLGLSVFVFLVFRYAIFEHSLLWKVEFYFLTSYLILVYLSPLPRLAMIQKRTARKLYQHYTYFVLLYVGYALTTIGSLIVSLYFAEVRAVFIFLFLGFHLMPIMLITSYYEKYESVAGGKTRDALQFLKEQFGITPREEEIIGLICEGKSNQEISETLFISLQTVKDHTHRIYTKTGVKNRVQLSNLVRKEEA